MMLRVAALTLVAVSANALQCGVPVVQPQLIDLNILGGQEAIPKSFPWQAGLYYKPIWDRPPYNHGEHFCAGALIDNRTVVTAAHCLVMSPSTVRIHLGAHTRASKDEDEIYAEIDHFCGHPDFFGNVNDIGIVRLKDPVTFNDAIRPICLPKANEDVEEDDKLYVTGWGFTSGGWDRRPAEKLMQARQVQITKKQCQEMRPIDTEKLICAIHTRGSSCHGDSGGPLQTKRDQFWQLQGVVSGGPPICGTPDWPLYYTETSRFINWISDYQRSADPKADGKICRKGR